MRKETIEKTATLLRLLSNSTRLRIVYLLIAKEGGLCVNEIATTVGLSHSATSHQMAKLKRLHLVESERIGQSICYRLKRSAFVRCTRELLDHLSDFARESRLV